jgi:hypothetical protein
VKPVSPHKKPNPKIKKVTTRTKDSAGNPEPEPPINDKVETNEEIGKATPPTEANIAVPSSPPAADNIIDVEELVESIDQPRRNPKRKCKSLLSGMDNSVPSYPTQERMESIDGHEEAPEPSEMTWTLSQLIQKNRRTNRQATTPKKIVQDEGIQVPTSTSVQMPKEPTPEPSRANTYEQSPNEYTHELNPDRNFDPADTYEHSPDHLLLNAVHTMMPIVFTPLLRSPKSLPMRLALQHSPNKRKHLKPTASSPPVGP